MKLLLLMSLLLRLISLSYAQTENVTNLKRLEIGDNLMEFTFSNKHNFPSWLKSTNDLKGKLILLDFWAIGCSICLERFPKMDSLQKEFGDKIQIIPINSSSEENKCLDYISKLKDENIKSAFESLPSINGDKRWGKLFPHVGVPHHVWIGADGRVMAITQEWNANRENIKAILNGAKLKFEIKDDLVEYDYEKKGIISQGHEKLPSPTLYSAFLPPFNGLGGGSKIQIDSLDMTYRVTHRNLVVHQLYFLTNKKIRCLVETNKIPKVSEIKATDDWQAANSFTYEIKMPLSEKNNYPRYMLEDLNRFFGIKYNILGVIESRYVTAYVLRKVDHSAALNHTEENIGETFKTDSKEENITTITGLKAHFRNYEDIYQNRVFIDETGITNKEKLNITLPLEVTDIPAINVYLSKYGLQLVKENREIEIMVIKDK